MVTLAASTVPPMRVALMLSPVNALVTRLPAETRPTSKAFFAEALALLSPPLAMMLRLPALMVPPMLSTVALLLCATLASEVFELRPTRVMLTSVSSLSAPAEAPVSARASTL